MFKRIFIPPHVLEHVAQVVGGPRVIRVQVQQQRVVIRGGVHVASFAVVLGGGTVPLVVRKALAESIRPLAGGQGLIPSVHVAVHDGQRQVRGGEARIQGHRSLVQWDGGLELADSAEFQPPRVQLQGLQRSRRDLGQRLASPDAEQGLPQVTAQRPRQRFDGLQQVRIICRGFPDPNGDFPRGGFHDPRRELITGADRYDSARDDRRIPLAPRDIDSGRDVHAHRVGKLHPHEDPTKGLRAYDTHVRRLVEVRDHRQSEGEAQGRVLGTVLELRDQHPVTLVEKARGGGSGRAWQAAEPEVPDDRDRGECRQHRRDPGPTARIPL